ncbi:diaminopimelate decarboxylase [Leucobacter rhizosphaerae]|uniref:Diaminopimelate decarboxylase n=1 Tax=Leucobacter rhizosphaerae TaxID=2932245 RepID=A0ABY4FTK4_9MICO|nr:diaminopimelate decarboxylase [Leucobacter rhizosphaerae]UOQ59612.1 diaminopimelate decarboxylase [Leucobacter rhizosphaerae]
MPRSRPLPPSLERVFPRTSGIGPDGELTIGECSIPELVQRFGTPLYAFDERGLRETMREYREGLSARWPNSRVCFASKSLPCLAAYALAQEEGLSVDVAGEGELRLALAAGVDPERLVLHGNAKSRQEIDLALRVGVGLIVVDNLHDIALLSELATGTQDVLIRVIPEIDAQTNPAIATGGRTSKFGLPIDQAMALIDQLQDHPAIRVRGVHLHIGSQILETEPFAAAVRVLGELGEFETYNIGGGLGVNYSEDDAAPTIDAYLDAVTEAARQAIPAAAELIIEPGRSLVARSGVTVYRVRNVKQSNDLFVAVDGGMSDQLNIALTDDRFTAVMAERVELRPDTTAQLVGRQCESGDLLVDRARLHAPRAGDIVALGATGAYGFTFVNNYNGALHPPVIFCADGESREAVRRQTYEEFIAPHDRTGLPAHPHTFH